MNKSDKSDKSLDPSNDQIPGRHLGYPHIPPRQAASTMDGPQSSQRPAEGSHQNISGVLPLTYRCPTAQLSCKASAMSYHLLPAVDQPLNQLCPTASNQRSTYRSLAEISGRHTAQLDLCNDCARVTSTVGLPLRSPTANHWSTYRSPANISGRSTAQVDEHQRCPTA